MTISENLVDPQRWNRYAYVRNNPFRYTDPTGMAPADIYDKSGNFIGSDGNDDGVIYVVTDDKTAKQLREKRKQGQSISPIEIPYGAGFYLQPAEQAAMVDAVARSNSPSSDDSLGGFHEEGFVSGSAGIKAAVPGAYTQLVDGAVAKVDLPGMKWVHLAAHVHPSGTSGTLGFAQEPSRPEDYNSAYGPGSANAVMGARSQTIYFYDRSRVVATMPLKRVR